MIAIEIPKIHYSTISYARLMSADMPFADPHRGAPFNQKNGPAIALVGAFSAISAGLTMTGILGGLMIAGGVMSGLGALTGNKTLSMLGGALSIATGIGASFVDAGGNFIGGEGYEFGNSAMGGTFDKFKNFFGDATGQVIPDAVSDAATTGAEIKANTIESAMDGAQVRGLDNTITTAASNPVAKSITGIGNTVGNVATGAKGAAGGGGLLSGIMGNKDLLNGASSMADAYLTSRDNEANRDFQQPLRDAQIGQYGANTASTNANTQLTQDRYNNMQAQPSVNIGVNPNVNLFNNPLTQDKKYAVVANGEVKYLNQAEYDALRQQQSGGGLLQQGAA